MRLLTLDEERAGLAQGITAQTRYAREAAIKVFAQATRILRVATDEECDETLILAIDDAGTAYLMHYGQEPRLLVAESDDGSAVDELSVLFDALIEPDALDLHEVEIATEIVPRKDSNANE